MALTANEMKYIMQKAEQNVPLDSWTAEKQNYYNQHQNLVKSYIQQKATQGVQMDYTNPWKQSIYNQYAGIDPVAQANSSWEQKFAENNKMWEGKLHDTNTTFANHFNGLNGQVIDLTNQYNGLLTELDGYKSKYDNMNSKYNNMNALFKTQQGARDKVANSATGNGSNIEGVQQAPTQANNALYSYLQNMWQGGI